MLTISSRALLLRDRLSGRMSQQLTAFPFGAERFVLLSGERRLSAVYLSAGEDAPGFLICHGIGERVEYWAEVQRVLRQMGFSSLVFNYTGFGASAGQVCTENCEEDAIAAFRELRDRGASEIFLLGFSLGTGVASAVAGQVDAAGVILCEGFCSLREAAGVAGFPRWLTLCAESVWAPEELVKEIETAVLVVHSDGDELFPVSMAERVAKACGERGEALVLSGLVHNAPIFAAPDRYWRPIVEWARSRIQIGSDEAPVQSVGTKRLQRN